MTMENIIRLRCISELSS